MRPDKFKMSKSLNRRFWINLIEAVILMILGITIFMRGDTISYLVDLAWAVLAVIWIVDWVRIRRMIRLEINAQKDKE